MGANYFRVVEDLTKKKKKERIAYNFHYTLACIIKDICVKIRENYKLNKVVLSGGVFQNRSLLNLATRLLKKVDFAVYTHRRFSCSDASISIGQVVAASRRI